MTKKIFFPVILLWRDRVIDAGGANRLVLPSLRIRKGRVLTIKNIGEGEFRLEVRGVMDVKGDIRIAKKPVEVSRKDLEAMRTAAVCYKISIVDDRSLHDITIEVPAFVENLPDDRRKKYLEAYLAEHRRGSGVESTFVSIISIQKIDL